MSGKIGVRYEDLRNCANQMKNIRQILNCYLNEIKKLNYINFNGMQRLKYPEIKELESNIYYLTNLYSKNVEGINDLIDDLNKTIEEFKNADNKINSSISSVVFGPEIPDLGIKETIGIARKTLIAQFYSESHDKLEEISKIAPLLVSPVAPLAEDMVYSIFDDAKIIFTGSNFNNEIKNDNEVQDAFVGEVSNVFGFIPIDEGILGIKALEEGSVASKEIGGNLFDSLKNRIHQLSDAIPSIGKDVRGAGEAGSFAGELNAKNISNMSKNEILDVLPKDWKYTENNGFVHVRDADGNIRMRIDPPDKVTNYDHVHLFDEKGNPIDTNLKVVDRKSPDAHIPYKK